MEQVEQAELVGRLFRHSSSYNFDGLPGAIEMALHAFINAAGSSARPRLVPAVGARLLLNMPGFGVVPGMPDRKG